MLCEIFGADRSRRSRLQTNVDSTRPETEPRLPGAVEARHFRQTLTRRSPPRVAFQVSRVGVDQNSGAAGAGPAGQAAAVPQNAISFPRATLFSFASGTC